MSKNNELKNETANGTKPVLCDVTLNHIINDCKERLTVLEQRKQTSATLGRIAEMQYMIVHFQQMVLDNIA